MTITCQACGRDFEHTKKGQRPRSCVDCRVPSGGRLRPFRCWVCGAEKIASSAARRPTCSTGCRSALLGGGLGRYPLRSEWARQVRRAIPPAPKHTPGGLRNLVEAGRYPEALASILERTTPVGECLVLSGKPYPEVHWGPGKNRRRAAHRVVLEAKLAHPIEGWQAHHTCANAACVRPEHLVPATHAANTAEMLGRRTYEAQIAALRAALHALDATHPLIR